MSKRESVIITDDLDGSGNAETVSFGFGGVTYEVDLSTKNRARLEKALGPFIEAGRESPAAAAAVVPPAQVGHQPISLTCGPGPGQLA